MKFSEYKRREAECDELVRRAYALANERRDAHGHCDETPEIQEAFRIANEASKALRDECCTQIRASDRGVVKVLGDAIWLDISGPSLPNRFQQDTLNLKYVTVEELEFAIRVKRNHEAWMRGEKDWMP